MTEVTRMDASDSDSDSRTAVLGRKRKIQEAISAWPTADIVPDETASQSGSEAGELTKRHRVLPSVDSDVNDTPDYDHTRATASASRRSSLESGEISPSIQSPQARSNSPAGLVKRDRTLPIAREDIYDRHAEGLNYDESSSESEDDSTDDSADDDEDASDAETDSASDSSSAHMSISSGDEYEAHHDISDTVRTNMLRVKDVSEKDQVLQYRYFKLTKPDTLVYCLCCGDRGHAYATCPARTCTYCNAIDQHASSACPSARKCSRCRERGHDAAACTGRSSARVLTCDVCGNTRHVEEECYRLCCTTVTCDYTQVHKIENDLMHRVCYRCGDSGVDAHWGDDCTMYYRDAPSSAELNLNMTWSAKHADKFIVGKERSVEEERIPEAEPATDKVDIETSSADVQTNNWQVALLDSILDDRWG